MIPEKWLTLHRVRRPEAVRIRLRALVLGDAAPPLEVG